MFFVSYNVLYGFYSMFQKHAVASVSLVLPFEVKGAFYVPFLYWLISIIIVMIVHESGHGVFARFHKIKVNASGFAVLGAIIPIIPGAFVDVNEKVMAKKPLFAQLSVLSAGPFANMVTGAFFLVLMLLSVQVINFTHINDGVLITEIVDNSPAKLGGLVKNEVIRNIDGKTIRSADDFVGAFVNKHYADSMLINSKKIVLGSNPDNSKLAYLGVFVEQKQSLKNEYGKFALIINALIWIKELFFWIFAINIGVGSFNLLPIGLLDGGRMFSVIVCKFLNHKHIRKLLATVNSAFVAVIFITIFYSFVGG